MISQIYLHIFNDCWVSSHSWTNNKAVKSWKPIFHLFYCCFSISEIDPFRANEAIKSITCTNISPKGFKFFFWKLLHFVRKICTQRKTGLSLRRRNFGIYQHYLERKVSSTQFKLCFTHSNHTFKQQWYLIISHNLYFWNCQITQATGF